MENNNKIKVFLASSDELSDERQKFGNFIRKLDMIYKGRGKNIEVFEWEDSDAADNDRRKQDEYNDQVATSDMFLAIFYKKGGKYTIEEYDVAMSEFRKKGSPKVYIYCKDLQEGEIESPELLIFKKRLAKEDNERFWINFDTQDMLHLHFVMQLMMVENNLMRLSLEGDKLTIDGIFVAELANLSFVASNKDYKQMRKDLEELPRKIEKARNLSNKYPDDKDLRDELQNKLDYYNHLKKEFAQLQKALFDTYQRIYKMQQDQLNDKLNRAVEAFKSGQLERANTILDEIKLDADSHYLNLRRDRELVHQDIEAFRLQAMAVMADMKINISERINQAKNIYIKANKWAKDSALNKKKYEELLFDYTNFLYDYGLYNEANLVCFNLLSTCKELYGNDHYNIAFVYNMLGRINYRQSRYNYALSYSQTALKLATKRFGENHPFTVSLYTGIGLIYDELGIYDKALEYHNKALSNQNFIEIENLHTAALYNNIGRVYKNQGIFDKALEFYQKALVIMKKVPDKDYQSTAITINNIGHVYYRIGNLEKAIEYYMKALDIREKMYGEHPDTSISYINVGCVYADKGMYDSAMDYFSKALAINKKLLGNEHPNNAFIYNNIGIIHDKKGDYIKAIQYYSKALNLYEKKFGIMHPDNITPIMNIGNVYEKLGNSDEALVYYLKAFKICDNYKLKEHPETPNVCYKIAYICN